MDYQKEHDLIRKKAWLDAFMAASREKTNEDYCIMYADACLEAFDERFKRISLDDLEAAIKNNEIKKTDANVIRAVEMYAEGESYKGIAREIGCSPNTIKGWILGFKETQLKNE